MLVGPLLLLNTLDICNFVVLSPCTCLPSHHYQQNTTLDNLIKIPPYIKEAIGIVYSQLNMDNLKPLSALKHQWEEELDTDISDIEWLLLKMYTHHQSV